MKSTLATTLALTATLILGSAQLATAQGVDDVRFSSTVEEFAGQDASVWKEGAVGGHGADCECCCGPVWTASADAIFMYRSRPDSQVLMYDLFDPARNLNADAFDFGFAAGWDMSLQRATSKGSLEARFFSIDGWDSATTAIVGSTPFVIVNNVMPFTSPGVTSVDATYNSELLSGELNLRRRLTDHVSLLGGFRYLELDEHLHADLNGVAALPTTYDTLTYNRLYGGQVGLDATLWCRGKLTVGGLAKFGVFHNSSGQNSSYDTGSVQATAADTSNRAAFLGELAFTGNYCLTDSLSLRAGYNLLWLETVTLAGDQIPVTNYATSSGIAADGGAFYHGAFAGLEFRR